MSSKSELQTRLTTALSEVTLAENVLEKTLRELGGEALRADKITVTADVADAFARLRKAREELNTLRDLIEKE